jgi:hypothetical protein
VQQAMSLFFQTTFAAAASLVAADPPRISLI